LKSRHTYTAITRGKKFVAIIGTKKALAIAIKQPSKEIYIFKRKVSCG